MKRTFFAFLIIVCSASVFPATIVNTNKKVDDIDLEDYIALSREGGTTRIASRMSTIQSAAAEPVVEATNGRNVVMISVQNYRGPAWVEIYGRKGAKQTYFEVYDMGFDVISLSGLGAGEYTIRISLGSNVFTGTFKKGKYGIR